MSHKASPSLRSGPISNEGLCNDQVPIYDLEKELKRAYAAQAALEERLWRDLETEIVITDQFARSKPLIYKLKNKQKSKPHI